MKNNTVLFFQKICQSVQLPAAPGFGWLNSTRHGTKPGSTVQSRLSRLVYWWRGETSTTKTAEAIKRKSRYSY